MYAINPHVCQQNLKKGSHELSIDWLVLTFQGHIVVTQSLLFISAR